jgi:hypothetical protein
MTRSITAPAYTAPDGGAGQNNHVRPPLDGADAADSSRSHTVLTRTPGRDGRLARSGMAVLLGLVALAVAAILLAPVALSSRDLLDWAAAPSGLGLPGTWPVLVILSLDAAAIACVLMSVLCTWRGEKPGIFGFLVWMFAITSAFANWRHGLAPAAPPDRFWFIPLMSMTGPGVLEVVLHRTREWLAHDQTTAHATGQATGPITAAIPAGQLGTGASWQRWIPGLGSFTDTLGAYRTRLLTPGIGSFTDAVTAYRQLCPDGSVRVAAALRRRHLADAQASLHDILTAPALVQKAQVRSQLPVDLMKRIPVQDRAFGRWITAWADLRGQDDLTGKQIQAVADRHGFSTRQIGFIRRAGEAGLLESTTPPAVRLAQAANRTRTRTT